MTTRALAGENEEEGGRRNGTQLAGLCSDPGGGQGQMSDLGGLELMCYSPANGKFWAGKNLPFFFLWARVEEKVSSSGERGREKNCSIFHPSPIRPSSRRLPEKARRPYRLAYLFLLPLLSPPKGEAEREGEKSSFTEEDK